MRFFTAILCAFLAIITSSAFAAQQKLPPLNQVTLQLTAEQWATTKTAKVTVNVSAALTSQGLEKMHAQLLSKLDQLAKNGHWHITRFYRYQDQSGLERVNASAVARLPSGELANLRSKAKAISKPGEKFSIQNIAFTPSLTEIEQVRSQLRETLYKQAKQELDHLNSVYPKQHYQLHTINFVGSGQPRIMPRPNTALIAMQKSSAGNNLAVSDKIQMSASVVLASEFDE